jgi:hypothetical protein
MLFINKLNRSEVHDVSTLPALAMVDRRAKYYKEFIKDLCTLLLIPYYDELKDMASYYEIDGNYYEPLFTNELEYWLNSKSEDIQLSIDDFI